MPVNVIRTRELLKNFDFKKLFIEELGWEYHNQQLDVLVDGQQIRLNAIAHKRGIVVFECTATAGAALPLYPIRRKIDQQATKLVREHIIIYVDSARTAQVWQWVKREPGKPTACREHAYHKNQPGDALIQKLQSIAFSIEEEEALTLTAVAGRTRQAFDLEKVTKKFYERFKAEHDGFLKFIKGIPDDELQRWYASVMLNRLMFIYFIQEKGFLDNNQDYLRKKLAESKERGKDKYYSGFLCPLFFEGFAKKEAERSTAINKLLGNIPYLNGGLFLKHQIEELHGKTIQISDSAFEKIFDFFKQYQWHLDERPVRKDDEINPDVLGYIFEKYINQKQMGAYYTKEDITEYISKNTVIPFLFDAAKQKCKIAFEGNSPSRRHSGLDPESSDLSDKTPDATIWRLLQVDPDRYIYNAVKHGMVVNIHENPPKPLEKPLPLPKEIAAGLGDVSKRTEWNRSAPPEYALPTEIWREVVARRKRYEEVREKLAKGEIRDINDFITYNLDIRQLAQDVIENSEGPELLRAFYHAIEKVTVLDPTCGSGAFLFAALNILEPLYEACLDRMEVFLNELERSGEKHRPEKYSDFKKILEQVEKHPNRKYFIFKSIIVNNLYGVDIMEEAIEICKLRLFLKLVAQIGDASKIEPLPDIDFNIRAGNTLVGFATYDEVKKAVTSKLDFENTMDRIEEQAQDIDRLFKKFHEQQTSIGGEITPDDKQELRKRLSTLENELNQYLAVEYGVDLRKKKSFEMWHHSHRPFHWFIEFYGILKNGGFDVIIGNPPYLEYSKVKDYTIHNYVTEKCANLYVFTVERSFTLSNTHAQVGMIVPISIACSGAMAPLRNHLAQTSRTLWLSHFSNRPGQLFTGAQNRLTIFVCSGRQASPQQFSTRYHRWNARDGERDSLFPTMRYQLMGLDASMFHGLMPKVGCPEAAALNKIKSNKTVELFTSKHGRHKVYWVRVPGYFCQFLIEPPKARDESGGPARVRGEVNDLKFDGKDVRHVVHAVLNSSTYYQFFCTYTDTRHINPSDVHEFPLDISSYAKQALMKLNELSTKLTECYAEHKTQWRKSGLLIDSIDSKPCKTIIDDIDRVLAKHYGFTDEELDFIINYDNKYRMGPDTEEDE